MAKGDSFSLTLDTPGTYDYYCTFRPMMRTTITVSRRCRRGSTYGARGCVDTMM